MGSEAPEPITIGKVLTQYMTATFVLRRLKDFSKQVRTEDGQALVEYGLLLSLIAFAALFAAQSFGLGVSGLYSTILANYP